MLPVLLPPLPRPAARLNALASPSCTSSMCCFSRMAASRHSCCRFFFSSSSCWRSLACASRRSSINCKGGTAISVLETKKSPTKPTPPPKKKICTCCALDSCSLAFSSASASALRRRSLSSLWERRERGQRLSTPFAMEVRAPSAASSATHLTFFSFRASSKALRAASSLARSSLCTLLRVERGKCQQRCELCWAGGGRAAVLPGLLSRRRQAYRASTTSFCSSMNSRSRCGSSFSTMLVRLDASCEAHKARGVVNGMSAGPEKRSASAGGAALLSGRGVSCAAHLLRATQRPLDLPPLGLASALQKLLALPQ